MNLTSEQQTAIRLILAGENVFLSGAAGTGKSTVIKAVLDDTENVVLLAPTGIAASNIGGQTIHAFGRFAPGLLCPDTISPIADKHYRALLNAVQLIIIDEISLVRADLFAALDHRFREAACGRNRFRPWAGKQIVVIGDFFQLPPVVATDEEEVFLNTRLNGAFAFSPELWRETNFTPVILREVQRQRDPLLLEILPRIRRGELEAKDIQVPGMPTPVTPIAALNMLCAGKGRAESGGLTLCGARKQADAINAEYCARLDSPRHFFKAEIEGKFLDRDQPTETNLSLQEGQRVMAVANRREAGGNYIYANGDLGTVNHIEVDRDGIGSVVVDFDNGNMVEVERHEWNTYRYELEVDRNTGQGVIKKTETGAFRQIPLRSGYAVTIHKAQGLTLNDVTVDVGNGCFASGQLYTALSRCRSMETLHLARRINKEDVLVAPEVLEFYRQLGA